MLITPTQKIAKEQAGAMPVGVDFIIPSRRGAPAVAQILAEAAATPLLYKNCNFIAILDFAQEAERLNTWVQAQRQNNIPLPPLTVLVASPAARQNLTLLRHQGVEAGLNPIVYFQDDDDPLPIDLASRVSLMCSKPLVAVYGVAETVNSKGHTVESFPVTSNGLFVADPLEASRYFPTYGHPLGAVFRREVFEKFPYADGQPYAFCGDGAFMLRLLQVNLPIAYTPYIFRRSRLHNDNDSGIFTPQQAAHLAQDIQLWQRYVSNPTAQAFQQQVARDLQNGSITTYREIAARIETILEEGPDALENWE